MVGPLEGGAYGKKLNDWRYVPEGLRDPGPPLSLSAIMLSSCSASTWAQHKGATGHRLGDQNHGPK